MHRQRIKQFVTENDPDLTPEVFLARRTKVNALPEFA
jgi:hypothetical protein